MSNTTGIWRCAAGKDSSLDQFLLDRRQRARNTRAEMREQIANFFRIEVAPEVLSDTLPPLQL
jgi:hypothetical protein